ncbi:MAG: CPBP family intramembrane metalloprotease [Planctomycetota bacterium]|nr:MAG: CPBP family intramembrane metalloprotease [Planctomycetota bacterium]REK20425.1 MAG: CPBP family intramembrane metalloprotease [Planctomycetota bacterium]REK29283.1 MAG: CPBP family intramembrane metalloprotease [Planctomycetota bacterium]
MSTADSGKPLADDYWSQARRPLAALLFLLPLLTVYEFGVMFFADSRHTVIRNGADCWMRGWLVSAGLQHPWLLPVAIVALLGGWHLWQRHPWRCSLDTICGMFAESLLFAMALVVLGQLMHLGFEKSPLSAMCTASVTLPSAGAAALAVSYVGAGIYEEVMFRLGLLPACLLGMKAWLPRQAAICFAVVLTSLVFAAAHYVEPSSGGGWTTMLSATAGRISSKPELWFGFVFRAVAGGLFAVLFLWRGFGVTVGCHAIYDLLVGVVMRP